MDMMRYRARLRVLTLGAGTVGHWIADDLNDDLEDGESTEVKGSAAKPYVLKNVGGVYSCTCPAWRNQSAAIERRTCKHLRKLRGDAAECSAEAC